MKLLFAYKHNPQDPTELALRRWLPREVPGTALFGFTDEERSRKTDFGAEPLLRLQDAVEAHGATHVFSWVPYLLPSEVRWLQARGIKVAQAVNGVTALSNGFCRDQGKLFDYLALLDWYFVPHAPHVPVLRAKGVNAAELPFCYDDDAFHPLAGSAALRALAPFRGSYVGNFGPTGIAQGDYRAGVLKSFCDELPMLVLCDAAYRKHGLRRKNFRRVPTISNQAALNFILNASGFTLGTDAFPEVDEYTRPSYENVHTPYDRARDAFVMRPRTFFSMGSGALFLVEDFPEMRRYFTPGEHLILWKTPADALAQLRDRGASELRAIADRGWRRVRHLHSARVRAGQIREILAGAAVPDFAREAG